MDDEMSARLGELTAARIARARARREGRAVFAAWHGPRREYGLRQRVKDKEARMQYTYNVSTKCDSCGSVIDTPQPKWSPNGVKNSPLIAAGWLRYGMDVGQLYGQRDICVLCKELPFKTVMLNMVRREEI